MRGVISSRYFPSVIVLRMVLLKVVLAAAVVHIYTACICLLTVGRGTGADSDRIDMRRFLSKPFGLTWQISTKAQIEANVENDVHFSGIEPATSST